MLKYLNTDVVFQEVPDEVTLAINITNCPNRCEDCHSKQLWNDIGTELNSIELENLISSQKGITCISFMGGDSEPFGLIPLLLKVKSLHLKTCWYSGKDDFSDGLIPYLFLFDYVKTGSYIKELGPLNKRGTNQKFYRVIITEKTDKYENHVFGFEDITYKFWK